MRIKTPFRENWPCPDPAVLQVPLALESYPSSIPYYYPVLVFVETLSPWSASVGGFSHMM